MRSRSRWWRALARKEWRELLSSRAWWVFLCLMGPLVGVSFISAVRTYAEASGLGGSAAGVGEAFSPLIGVWAPTFSACELAAAFLWPFVVIRLVSGDRQSGALKLELQHHSSALTRLGIKGAVLLAGWLIASAAPLLAIGLWKTYGGTLYAPELLAVAFGHVLNAGLAAAVAAAAAAMTEHPSTAAILTLGVTVGTWVLNFVAAVHGGVWERAARFTPAVMVAELQHGLVRLDVVLVAAAAIAALAALAAIWIRVGVAARRRGAASLAVCAGAAIVMSAAGLARASWDLSENRANSFSRADERALGRINAPLRMVVHLAPQDPRRTDLDRFAIARLHRVMPSLEVRYESATSIGLFEQTNAAYGEVWYELGGKRAVSRATTAEDVLARIYEISGVAPAAEDSDETFRGHPLAVEPRGAALVFYGLWPAAVVGMALVLTRKSWGRGS